MKKGFVKAKADIEDSRKPNHRHTHVETPNPLREEAKLWVEIESNGTTLSGSFGLI